MRRAALGLLLVVALAGCGGGSRTPVGVVRAWAEALGAGDNERAAALFGPNAAVVQADQMIRLRTHSDAVRWNARLPCAGRIVSLTQDGSAVTATFRLRDRTRGSCRGPAGAEAIALFVVEHGRIILWDQIGSQVRIGH